MSPQLSCINGHFWERLSTPSGATLSDPPRCPTCGAPAISQQPPTLPQTADGTPAPSGVRIAGFEILEIVGRGGMGVVYKALQVQLNRLVALKILLAGAHAGDADLARFRAEAEATARLQHPNIVQLHEVGESDGRPFLCLEFVAGGTLARELAGKPLSAEAAARLVYTLACAVQYAHDNGVIHRDLNPANVLLSFNRERLSDSHNDKPPGEHPPLREAIPKISDFGLAKRLDVAGHTVSGAVMGTPSYMAPEQAGGKNRVVGPASDIYALGAILYDCLTGRAPFVGASIAETLYQVLTHDPVAPRRLQPKVSSDLEAVCLKCLEKDPARRYASAGDLADDLGRYLAGAPTVARPISKAGRLVRWCRRNPAIAALTGAVAALLALTTIVSTVQALRLDAAREAALQSADNELKQRKEAEQSAQREREARADVEKQKTVVEDQKKDVEKQRTFAQEQQQIADRERKHSDALRREAERERKQAEASLYVSRLTLAANAWAANDVDLTEQHLSECPSDLMHWEWRYLKGLCRAGLSTVALPVSYPGRRVAMSRDGRRAAVINYSNHNGGPFAVSRWAVTLCDTTNGKVLHEAEVGIAAVSPVFDVALSPDGKFLATGANKGLQLWDAETGVELRSLPPLPGNLRVLAFTPDNKFLICGDEAVSLYRIELGSGDKANSDKAPILVANQGRGTTALAVSPDGLKMATGSDNGEVRLWLTDPPGKGIEAPRSPLHLFAGHKGPIHALAFSPNGKRLASAGEDGTVRIWDTETEQSLYVLRWHNRAVTTAVFSPDGKRLTTGSDDRTVCVWDATNGEQLFALRGHHGAVQGLAYSGDGKRLLSAGDDATLRTWDATNGQQGLRLPGGEAVAFSLDGKQVATPVAESGAIAVWDAATGAQQFTLPGHGGHIRRLAFVAEGKQLAVAAMVDPPDGPRRLEVSFWDIAERKLVRTLQQEGDTCPLGVFGAGGKRVVLPVKDGMPEIWDLLSGERQRGLPGWLPNQEVVYSPDGERVAGIILDPGLTAWLGTKSVVAVRSTAKGHEEVICAGQIGRVTAVAFGPHTADDMDHFALGGFDGSIRLWDVRPGGEAPPEGGAIPRAPRLVLRGHLYPVRALAFSADGRRLASVSCDDRRHRGEVKIWDVAAGHELLTIARPGRDVAFDPAGVRLAVADPDGTTWVWEGEARPELITRRGAGNGISLSPDGRMLAVTGESDTVAIWESRSGRPMYRLPGRSERNAKGHTQSVRRAVFSADGRFIATAGADHAVKLWDAETHTVLRTFEKGHSDAVLDVAFSPDGTQLASAGSDEVVIVWDVGTGKKLATFDGHGDRVSSVVFSPNGKLLASGGDDKMVRIWEVHEGQARELRKCVGHEGLINCVAFSPDGTLLASAGDDAVVRLWDVESGTELRKLVGHGDAVRRVVFSPDGKRLATAGWDRLVKVWSVADGKELLNFAGHESGVTSVAFGQGRVVSADEAQTVRIWAVKE